MSGKIERHRFVHGFTPRATMCVSRGLSRIRKGAAAGEGMKRIPEQVSVFASSPRHPQALMIQGGVGSSYFELPPSGSWLAATSLDVSRAASSVGTAATDCRLTGGRASVRSKERELQLKALVRAWRGYGCDGPKASYLFPPFPPDSSSLYGGCCTQRMTPRCLQSVHGPLFHLAKNA